MGLTVVTGAAGLVGGNLVRRLLADGRTVRAVVHRNHDAIAGLDLPVAVADVADLDALVRAFAGAHVVYHLAGSISIRMDNWDEMSRVNITGLRHVIEACRRVGVRRLISFSSVHALQREPLDRPLDESRPELSDPQAPPYERSKAAGHRLLRDAIAQGLDAVLLLPTAIVGPLDFRPSYIGQALLKMANGTLPVLVEGGYDWVDVRDVVAGSLQAERLAPTGGTYILSGHWRSITEVAQEVAHFSGRPAPRLTFPMWLAQLGEPFISHLARINGSEPLYTRAALNALCSNRLVSHERASRDFGYAPRPFEETIRDTLEWLLEHWRRKP